MAEETNIGWTDFTGGPYLVCSKKSAGCANCYAMILMERRHARIVREAYRKAGLEDWESRPIWGPSAPRVLTKGFWNQARAWNKKCVCSACGESAPVKALGQPHDGCKTPADGVHRPVFRRARMFPSLIDWLDEMPAGIMDQDGKWLDPNQVRADFLEVIYGTPNLDWLLLTKRPENWRRLLGAANDCLPPGEKTRVKITHWVGSESLGLASVPPENVWIGVSVENQRMADERIPLLLQIPAKVRFLSCEPLLERIDLVGKDAQSSVLHRFENDPKVDWVIVGGESGSDRRDCGVEAIVSVAEQCAAAGVPVFVKQDCEFKSEQQGRIPDEVWALKQFPEATR